MIYTVIGFDESTGNTFAHETEADGPHQAMAWCSAEKLQRGEDQAVVGATYVHEGKVLFVPPCEDSGNLAYACDLSEDESDEEGNDHGQQ